MSIPVQIRFPQPQAEPSGNSASNSSGDGYLFSLILHLNREPYQFNHVLNHLFLIHLQQKCLTFVKSVVNEIEQSMVQTNNKDYYQVSNNKRKGDKIYDSIHFRELSRLDSNIKSKSSNNTYLNIIEIFNKLSKKLNIIESRNLIITST